MDVENYRVSNHQRLFLLHEKGGKERQVPAHHRVVECMDASSFWNALNAPLFHALDVTRSRLKGTRMNRQTVFQMVRRRARAAGTAAHGQLPQLPRHLCPSTSLETVCVTTWIPSSKHDVVSDRTLER